MSKPQSFFGDTRAYNIGAYIAEKLLWGLSAAAVVSLHVGAAMWLLRAPPVLMTNTPPPAIMIEFAPTIEAINTDETELSVETQDNQASLALEDFKEPAPEEKEAETAEEEVEVEDQDEPVVEPEKVVVKEPAVVAMPRPPRRRVQVAKPPSPRAQTKSSPSRNSVKAASRQATKSARNTATQSARGSGRALSPAKWQSRLLAHLERYKPRSKGQRGTAYVTFRISASGKVLSVKLARSSGVASVDKIALNLVRRASPVPAPPPGVKRSITVPVRFNRR